MQSERFDRVLPLDLGDGLTLTLRDVSTVDETLALVHRNLERLRTWEHWAHGEQTREGMLSATQLMERDYRSMSSIPVVIRREGTAIGAASARRSGVLVEIGFWVDSEVEGQGIATRVSQALMDAWAREGITRFLIRTASDNFAARGVAEKLGFALDEVRPRSFPVGPELRDCAYYRLDTGRPTRD